MMKKSITLIFTSVLLALSLVQCTEVDPIIKPQMGEFEKAPVYPDKPILPQYVDVGLSTVPEIPDADKACTIYFEPKDDSKLYGTTDDLYMHIGIYSDMEWLYVQAGWNENLDKCKLEKVGPNKWALRLEPTIRDYFQSGETSIEGLALIVRNADGDVKTAPDCIIAAKDQTHPYKAFQPDDIPIASLPQNVEYGINYNTDNSVTLVLKEEDKLGGRYDYCYLIGEATGWERKPEYIMNRDKTAGCWWYTIPADQIDPDKEYMFQYFLGNENSYIRISDPYTEIVYDGWNDSYISSTTYPDIPAYPQTKGLVSAFKVNRDEYNWEIPDFKIKDKNDLIIYELLIRDFTESKDLHGVMEKLDYLAQLGITAIELMPVQEFDGNDSWGYNPNHYFALDKAYGTRQMYKKFIDECHKRGIAVLFDVVYNHATGIAPMASLYYKDNMTMAKNPWFNVEAPHQFSVFHDWNHENLEVRDHIKRSLVYLLEEYHIDGFRFDLSKGFTQKRGTEGSYDQSRVDILKDYNSVVKKTNPDAVVILEHFVDSENGELGKDGMKVWRNCNPAFRATAGGGNANLSYLRDGYEPFGTCVGFMESHDEERTLLPWGGEAKSLRARAPRESISWGVVGTMNNWGKADASGKVTPDKEMISEGKYFVASAVTLTTSDKFKIRAGNNWNDAYNYGSRHGSDAILSIGVPYEMELGGGSQNLSVSTSGTYDILFHLDSKQIWVMEQGKRPDDSQLPETDEETLLQKRMRRGALNAAFFLTVPGPKMIWQFGEMGYDISIKEGGANYAPKPLHWDYLDVPERKELHDTYAGLLRFRKENPRFFDQDAHFEWYVEERHYPCKTIYGSADGKNFVVIGNFSQNAQQNVTVDFKASGNWRNWFNENEKYQGSSATTTLKGSEFRLYVNF